MLLDHDLLQNYDLFLVGKRKTSPSDSGMHFYLSLTRSSFFVCNSSALFYVWWRISLAKRVSSPFRSSSVF